MTRPLSETGFSNNPFKTTYEIDRSFLICDWPLVREFNDSPLGLKSTTYTGMVGPVPHCEKQAEMRMGIYSYCREHYFSEYVRRHHWSIPVPEPSCMEHNVDCAKCPSTAGVLCENTKQWKKCLEQNFTTVVHSSELISRSQKAPSGTNKSTTSAT